MFGRHFFAGEDINTFLYVINDDLSGARLEKVTVEVSLKAEGATLASERVSLDDIPYYATAASALSIRIPEEIGAPRVNARLCLKVISCGRVVSVNDYALVIAKRDWAVSPKEEKGVICFDDDYTAQALLRLHGMNYRAVSDLTGEFGAGDRLVAASPLNRERSRMTAEFVENGGYAVLFNQRDTFAELTPGFDVSYTEDPTEIMTMNVPESGVFSGLEEGDTAYFENGRDVPYACFGRYALDRMNPDICALGETLAWHSYMARPTDYAGFGGTPLFALRLGRGGMLLSAVRIDADEKDPVAMRLNDNALTWNFEWRD